MENFDNNQLIATALILIRQLPIINKKFIYIPRGMVLDYSNLELLNFEN